MLHFFARRLREMQEVRRDERGFTLIELLVVVIIIGVLAAIAIPVFLAQRERAYRAELESDLRNIGAAATSCSVENNGSFAACDTVADLTDNGYNQSPNVNPDAGTITATDDRFQITGVTHDNTDLTGGFDSDTGRVTITEPAP